MPGLLFTMSGQVTCSHGGQAKFIAPNMRVKLSGVYAPIIAAPMPIAGCSMPPPPAGNGPDVTGFLTMPTGTTRVTSNGLALVVQSTQGLGAPTGAPLILVTPGQTRVQAI